MRRRVCLIERSVHKDGEISGEVSRKHRLETNLDLLVQWIMGDETAQKQLIQQSPTPTVAKEILNEMTQWKVRPR